MSRRSIATTLLFSFTLASCHVWTPWQGIPHPVPPDVRVQLQSGEELELTEARVEADTLKGRQFSESPLIRLPLDQIDSVEGRSLSGGRTALLVVGIGVVGLVIAGAIDFAQGDWLDFGTVSF